MAKAVRDELMSHTPDPLPEWLNGHGPDGGPMQGDHLAVVPIPESSEDHILGKLLGVALIAPVGLSPDQLSPLHNALTRWAFASSSPGDAAYMQLNMGRLGRWTLTCSDPTNLPKDLHTQAWTRPSTHWVSRTPIILDRHPGSLKGRPAERRRALARIHTTIEAACTRLGLPTPERITPLFGGSFPAYRFVRPPNLQDRRPLLHVDLSFAEPVGGPVLLGAGRYCGLGLMQPLG